MELEGGFEVLQGGFNLHVFQDLVVDVVKAGEGLLGVVVGEAWAAGHVLFELEG